MRCDDIQNQLSAWVDRELPPDEQSAVAAHLAGCAACQAAADALRSQGAELRAAFGALRSDAERIAERTLAEFASSPVVTTRPARRGGTGWLSLLLATCAGFLLATVIYAPWAGRENVAAVDQGDAPGGGSSTPQPPKPAPIAARLVVATGNVEIRPEPSAEWAAVSGDKPFDLNLGCAVRTDADVRCELATADGGVVRMNAASEVSLPESGQVAVERGEVWCRAPGEKTLTMIAKKSAATEEPSLLVFQCPPNVEAMASVGAGGALCVTSADGNVEIAANGATHTLERGDCATIADGKIETTPMETDPLLAARWMYALLEEKGHADPEWNSRVDALLARVGQAKMSSLYEQEIRSLGEYGVLPLLRYVESPLSREDETRRQDATRILADLAPTWGVRDLISLLADGNAEVRAHAAGGLKRLTGETQGREPERWREEWESCRETYALWQTWWQKNQTRFPPRFDRPPVEIPRETPGPQFRKKA